jgi:hypothetical protein
VQLLTIISVQMQGVKLLPNDAIHLPRASKSMHPVNSLGSGSYGQVIAGVRRSWRFESAFADYSLANANLLSRGQCYLRQGLFFNHIPEVVDSAMPLIFSRSLAKPSGSMYLLVLK